MKKKKLLAKINMRSGATAVAVIGGSMCEKATWREGGRSLDAILAKVQMWKKKKMQGYCLKMLTVGQYIRPSRHHVQVDEAASLQM